jgi:TRAP-type mannitol/chloroaromatic compound transport system substrate-binding protein
VAPYYYYPGWWEGTGMGTAYFNQKAWDSLPPLYRKAIEGFRKRR